MNVNIMNLIKGVFLFLVLFISLLAFNNKCNAAELITPTVVKVLAPNRIYSIGSSKKAACIISKNKSSVSFILPNNPKTLGSIAIRTDYWILTADNGFNGLKFNKVRNGSIDKDGHELFALYDNNGSLVQVIKGFIDAKGVLNVTWLKP
jgi:hypothetical protein